MNKTKFCVTVSGADSALPQQCLSLEQRFHRIETFVLAYNSQMMAQCLFQYGIILWIYLLWLQISRLALKHNLELLICIRRMFAESAFLAESWSAVRVDRSHALVTRCLPFHSIQTRHCLKFKQEKMHLTVIAKKITVSRSLFLSKSIH